MEKILTQLATLATMIATMERTDGEPTVLLVPVLGTVFVLRGN